MERMQKAESAPPHSAHPSTEFRMSGLDWQQGGKLRRPHFIHPELVEGCGERNGLRRPNPLILNLLKDERIGPDG